MKILLVHMLIFFQIKQKFKKQCFPFFALRQIIGNLLLLLFFKLKSMILKQFTHFNKLRKEKDYINCSDMSYLAFYAIL